MHDLRDEIERKAFLLCDEAQFHVGESRVKKNRIEDGQMVRNHHKTAFRRNFIQPLRVELYAAEEESQTGKLVEQEQKIPAGALDPFAHIHHNAGEEENQQEKKNKGEEETDECQREPPKQGRKQESASMADKKDRADQAESQKNIYQKTFTFL